MNLPAAANRVVVPESRRVPLPIRQRRDEQQVGDGLHLLAMSWVRRDLEPVAPADVSQTTVDGRAVPHATACYTVRVTLDPAEFVLPASVS